MISDILIRPAEGAFDVEQLRTHLEQTPTVAVDPIDRRIYMMTSSEAELALAMKQRRENPDRFPFVAILIEMSAEEVEISYRTDATEPAREFVHWLHEQCELVYLDEEFNDLTASVDEQLEFLFGPATSGTR